MKKFDDQIRWWWPTFVILCLTWSARADLDLGVGGTFRSYPLSGVVEGRAGYGVLLYGTAGSPISGYLRPHLEVNSAATYNSGLAQLEFFPLAFLGARAGGEAVQNDKDYSPYDCQSYRCLGRFHRTFFAGELTLGAGPVFIRGMWRRERWSQAKEQAGDFIDPTSGLVMRAGGESQTVYYGVGGIKLNETWGVMGGVRYAEDDDGLSRMPFAMVRFTQGDFSLGLGAGQFESSLKDKGFTAWGYFAWDFMPSSVQLR